MPSALRSPRTRDVAGDRGKDGGADFFQRLCASDFAVHHFDDVEADLMLNPLLTTVRVPKIELGAEAFRLIVNILKNKKSTPKKILVPVELIVRKSTTQLKPK